VVPKTTQDRQKYWTHWCQYSSLFNVHPFLHNVSPLTCDIIVCAFAAKVRRGTFGQGHQIKVQGVTDALSAISQTIMLAGQLSPIYRSEKIYNLNIQCMVEGMRRDDPPAIPQLAVPIAVANAVCEAGNVSPLQHVKTVGCLTITAFYFLLRVGEYTQPRFVHRNGTKVRATRTKQFTVGNIGFFAGDKLLPRNSSLAVLLTASAATLKITNQKNGRMGDTIHQKAIGGQNCPIAALAKQVHHILSNGGTDDSLLCSYYQDDEWHTVHSSHIVHAVCSATKMLRLDKQGIDPDLVGAHSLRAGGAMALKLHGFADTTIMKMGRWTSLTFLQYIHTQIAHLAKDISEKMSIPLPFLNIAAVDSVLAPV
jgi:hypothetical protein